MRDLSRSIQISNRVLKSSGHSFPLFQLNKSLTQTVLVLKFLLLTKNQSNLLRIQMADHVTWTVIVPRTSINENSTTSDAAMCLYDSQPSTQSECRFDVVFYVSFYLYTRVDLEELKELLTVCKLIRSLLLTLRI